MAKTPEKRIDTDNGRQTDAFNDLFVECCSKLGIPLDPLPTRLTHSQAAALLGIKKTVLTVYLSHGTIRREGRRGISFDSVVERLVSMSGDRNQVPPVAAEGVQEKGCL